MRHCEPSWDVMRQCETFMRHCLINVSHLLLSDHYTVSVRDFFVRTPVQFIHSKNYAVVASMLHCKKKMWGFRLRSRITQVEHRTQHSTRILEDGTDRLRTCTTTFKPAGLTLVILCLSRWQWRSAVALHVCWYLAICYVSRHIQREHTCLAIPHLPGRFGSISTNILWAAATVRYVPASF
jgi:hypothetical protein